MGINLKKVLTCLFLTSSIVVGSFSTGFTTANAAIHNDSKVTVINEQDKVKEFAEKNNIDLKKDGKKLSEIVIKRDNTSNEKTASKENVQANSLSFGYYLEFVESGEVCGTKSIDKTSGNGPCTLTLNVSKSVAATWNATCGISASGVSAGIGTSVTKSYSISDTMSISVASGDSETIAAMPLYDHYTFDVYYEPLVGVDYRAGDGEAYIPSGVCFVHYSN